MISKIPLVLVLCVYVILISEIKISKRDRVSHLSFVNNNNYYYVDNVEA